jgi:transposase
LRSLERWARRFPEHRWAVENAGGLGRHLAVRLAGSGESVVDVPPKLSARVRVLSSGNAGKNDGVDALATALAASRNERVAAVDPEAASEAMRRLSERRDDLREKEITLFGGALDEAPAAYKDPRAVMVSQADLVEAVGEFSPGIVCMDAGSKKGRRRRKKSR